MNVGWHNIYNMYMYFIKVFILWNRLEKYVSRTTTQLTFQYEWSLKQPQRTEQNQVYKLDLFSSTDWFPYSNVKYDSYYNLTVNNFYLWSIATHFLKQVRSSGRPVCVECGWCRVLTKRAALRTTSLSQRNKWVTYC